MNKIHYPNNLGKKYLEVFKEDLKALQSQWGNLRKQYPALNKFPQRIRTILTADFSKLTDLFFDYKQLPNTIKKQFFIKIKKTRQISFLNYNKYSKAISKFLCDYNEEMQLFSCCYCDIHPIGKYSIEINNSRKTFWRTFDLDHFYPQNQCPLLALSLNNLVPSCQVCNSRVKGCIDLLSFYGLKKKTLIIEQKNILNMISPSSKHYNFDDNTIIMVLPQFGFDGNISFLENYRAYKIIFDATEDYIHEIDAFRLVPRYNSIPILLEALSILDLKRKYPLAKIMEIHKLLNENGKKIVSVQEIEETIFRKEYDKKRKSNLQKLKQDLIG